MLGASGIHVAAPDTRAAGAAIETIFEGTAAKAQLLAGVSVAPSTQGAREDGHRPKRLLGQFQPGLLTSDAVRSDAGRKSDDEGVAVLVEELDCVMRIELPPRPPRMSSAVQRRARSAGRENSACYDAADWDHPYEEQATTPDLHPVAKLVESAV